MEKRRPQNKNSNKMILNKISKIPNRLENLIIVIIVASISAFSTYKSVILLRVKPMEAQFNKQLDSRDRIIIDLAEIAKYNYEISNSFGKIKPKNGQIIIDLKNKLDALNITSLDTMVINKPSVPKKEGFIKRFFKFKN